jgi:hypothetical protein
MGNVMRAWNKEDDPLRPPNPDCELLEERNPPPVCFSSYRSDARPHREISIVSFICGRRADLYPVRPAVVVS